VYYSFYICTTKSVDIIYYASIYLYSNLLLLLICTPGQLTDYTILKQFLKNTS
jgi:hypothetical protein